MLYVPRHLPNKLEYKVLCCISVHYQLRMTSNGIANTPSRFHSAGRQGKMMGVWFTLLGESLYAYPRLIRWGGGFVLWRRGRRSSIQGDEISCIRDHLK